MVGFLSRKSKTSAKSEEISSGDFSGSDSSSVDEKGGYSSEDSRPASVDEKTPLKSAPDGKHAGVAIGTDEFSSLSESDAKILREQVAMPDVKATFFTLFRYADSKDKLIMCIALISSIISGAMRPLMTVRSCI